MEQEVFIHTLNKKAKKDLGSGLSLEIIEGEKREANLYRGGICIKKADLSDPVARRLFVTETIDLGAKKNRLAKYLEMSRQTIHNYLEIKKYFGLEGLIHGYTPSDSKSLRTQRELHLDERIHGNKARKVEEVRKTAREEMEQNQRQFNFSFGDDDKAQTVAKSEQPFFEEHDWESTRYAGVFSYLIPLITEWKWLQLVMGHFGGSYRIFMVFILMAARNIRSIEQLKNVRLREAGIVLGIKRLPSKPTIWEWFYHAAHKQISHMVLMDYFRYQIRMGLVGLWLWFTDGHLLPYTGRMRVRMSYNTQRRMPVPGRTNLVSCDASGRVIYFEIQEGKGDLRGHISALWGKWGEDIPECPVMVFDREAQGAGFFWGLIREGITFVTWEKYTDPKKLAAIDKEKFTEHFELNGKKYSVFEEEKIITFDPDDDDTSTRTFKLRRIYLWNRTSKRRACGLAWSGEKKMNTIDCAHAILSRWGASENTFKHLSTRHPLHYHPGFKLVKSDNQEITNPAIKEKQREIDRTTKKLNKLYKKLAKTPEVKNIDGKPRQNSKHAQLKTSINTHEQELERLKEEKNQLPDKIDISSLEDYKSFKRIDNEGKNLFDFVTTSVWNVRKQMVDWLRPFFNQENELIDLFYEITYSHGWIKSTKREVIVRLEPLQQPKRRLAQEQLCRKLTALAAQTPSGKWLVVEVGESPIGDEKCPQK